MRSCIGRTCVKSVWLLLAPTRSPSNLFSRVARRRLHAMPYSCQDQAMAWMPDFKLSDSNSGARSETQSKPM
jgi:hypothetical protein